MKCAYCEDHVAQVRLRYGASQGRGRLCAYVMSIKVVDEVKSHVVQMFDVEEVSSDGQRSESDDHRLRTCTHRGYGSVCRWQGSCNDVHWADDNTWLRGLAVSIV